MVHHSELLHRAGIDGDRAVWLDPEFDVRERIVHVCDIPLVSALGGSDYADVFLGQRALARLERYLRERFGTPEALVEFAKDYWDVARGQLEQAIIIPPNNAGQNGEKRLLVELTALSGCSLVVSADWQRGTDVTVLRVRVDLDKALIDPGVHFIRCVYGNMVELLLREGKRAVLRPVSFSFVGETTVDITGMVVQELGPVVGVDKIEIYRASVLDDYHAWRDLFLDKRYRVQAWNEPFDFDRAIGLTEVAA